MSMQKALILPSQKDPWTLVERPIPSPGKGEILVKLHSIALNPVDWKLRFENYFPIQFPAVLGCDAAGVVEKVGEGATGFVVGDKVFYQTDFFNNDKSAFQQYAITPAEIAAKIPASLSFDEAATIPLCLATGACGLYNSEDKAGLGLTYPWVPEGEGKYTGQSILVYGGSSSIGQYTIQLARMSGFSIIVTVSSKKHEEYLKSLGATHVIDRNVDAAEAMKSITANGKVDYGFDTISSSTTQPVAIDIVKDGGSLIIVLAKIDGLNIGDKKMLLPFGQVHVHRELGISLYKALPELIGSGKIKPNRPQVVPGGLAKGITDGLALMEAEKVSGVKLIVHPKE